MDGRSLPALKTAVPGPTSRAWVDRLARRECPAITARRARRAATLGTADTDPMVWDEALGANVRDVDGNVFVDLTAGFGAASVGHRHPRVVAAGRAQLSRLPHAMGDAFPDPRRIELLERLAAITGLDHSILGTSGSDAVEAALKTARIASGRPGVLAFSGGYHGLSYGALAATAYKSASFRAPFEEQLGHHVRHAPFGGAIDLGDAGAVLVEPIQGRGGIRVPPAGWLGDLREACDQAGAVLILDEIYTGFGRTGSLFAFQAEGLLPDLVCLGKGMAGGAPISACVGRREIMEAWGASAGEALHTQTFLGHPPGCAMALACIQVILETALPQRAAELGRWFADELAGFGQVRGRGLLLGLEVTDSLALSRGLLERGFIALPAGEQAEVLALTPPLTVTKEQLEAFLGALGELS
ncbi:MAG TPA: aspartate aminotransferase family protein [Myxococcota bacterium]|nr:aspartate aminotransferase family protein [Myxococcota bacterium]